MAVAAFAQSVTGIGFGLVAAPGLVAALGPVEGIATVAMLSSLVNAGGMAAERRAVDVREAALLLLPAAVVTPFAALALRAADPELAMGVAGAVTLTGAGLLVRGVRVRAQGRRLAAAAGAVSAAMNVAGGVGGPAVALYGTNAGWPAAKLRATLQAYLLGVNLLTVAALGIPGVVLELPLALAAGTVAGLALAPRIPEPTARLAVLALAALGGASLLVRALA